MSFRLFEKVKLSSEEAAALLKTSPELLSEFEAAYKPVSDTEHLESDNLFGMNSRDASAIHDRKGYRTNPEVLKEEDAVIGRIVDELLAISSGKALPADYEPLSNKDLKVFPEAMRPQLTGTLIKKDLSGPTYPALLYDYKQWLATGDKIFYHMFRHGLDTLDLDPVVYEVLSMNPISMGHWFPTLKTAAEETGFFKVPETKIVKVPLSILQLTRLDYFSLNAATIEIVNKWAQEAFSLDENKTYFIKTGTYSSKFDFRNAKVTAPEEVRDIGQYLLFIQFQANSMAHYDLSGRQQACIYGVSTTNEWVVREYIEDKENLPCIYHGMPLHTEYRAFVDFDTDELLGIFPYWDPALMKKRFSQGSDADTADMKHDYTIFLKEEERLQKTFDVNKDKVAEEIRKILPSVNLKGQWSLDVMQNGDDFWLIDMALATYSALVDKLPMKLTPPEENWLPDFNNKLRG